MIKILELQRLKIDVTTEELDEALREIRKKIKKLKKLAQMNLQRSKNLWPMIVQKNILLVILILPQQTLRSGAS